MHHVRKRLSHLLAAPLLWLAMAAGAGAAPHYWEIWSGLVLATNEDHPAAMPAELAKYREQLGHIFGYNQYELIGGHAEKMDDPLERWLTPSKDFCLRVVTRNNAEHIYRMKLELFQKDERLAEFETQLGEDSPLFIRGPMYAGGQLIIVLLVKEPPK